MKAAWPAGPILMIFFSFGIVLTSVFFAGRLDSPPKQPAMAKNLGNPTKPQTTIDRIRPNNPKLVSGSVSTILASSVFAPDRSEFTLARPKPPPPKKPTFQPQFVGTLGTGEKLRAMVIWSKNGEAQTHRMGDGTPWGELVSISSTRLEFSGPAGNKELNLF